MSKADYGFEALLEFLEYAGEKGLINRSTARGFKAAASKIEDDLTEQEAADVREIDPDVVFQRFTNRNKVQVAPSTLLEYKRRLARMVSEFEKWRNDPTTYRPKGSSSAKPGGRKAKKTKGSSADSESSPRPRSKDGGGSPKSKPTEEGGGRQMINLPYPIRPDVLATVQVPRDMTSEEASRLAAFVRTLAVDFKPRDG